MKTILIKFLFISLYFTHCFAMSSAEVDIESASSELDEISIKIEDYYHQDTKTLDMSNLPLKDSLMAELIEEIKALIELTGAENLLLENNKLNTIPYELITFALTNKTLKYVSFKNNKFKIQNGSPQPEAIGKLIKKAYSKDTSGLGDSRKRSNTISGVISSIWDGISPEIEKAITKYNNSQDRTKFFKKIIIIDKRIPPITIINQDELPKNTKTRCKEIFYKILYVGSGIVVTLVPTLVTYFTASTSCDMNELNSMMQACNFNSTFI